MDATGRLGARRIAWLIDRACEALAPLGLAGEVRVRVVDDAEMATAHARWAGVEGTTDVLTFDLRDDPADPLDTDVLACLDEAERQAVERGHAPERELLLYLVHAVLHCCGHDDHDEADAARMHALEDDLLERAGVGATFDASRPGATKGGVWP
ncbi:MAG TPA: rRNA maturation RNase YbeY [Phycisphaerales bacterium]|nr:rRNA maturation RNase YbeY [Phycisphaerales bacterium]